MDDGSLQNKGLHLNVYGFSYNEVVLLKSTLETLFNPNAFIKCSIHNHKKGDRNRSKASWRYSAELNPSIDLLHVLCQK